MNRAATDVSQPQSLDYGSENCRFGSPGGRMDGGCDPPYQDTPIPINRLSQRECADSSTTADGTPERMFNTAMLHLASA